MTEMFSGNQGLLGGCVRKGDLGLKEPSPLIKMTGLRALCRERLRKKKVFKTHYCGFHH